jgi:CDP-6-deoxy-D-xylo-4-hexulose-3-dehydrase
MVAAKFRVSGSLEQTDNIMNNTFWIGLHPALTKEMLEYVVEKIEVYLGMNF